MKKKIFITGGSGLLALNWAAHKRFDQLIYLVQHTRKISLSGTFISRVDLSNKHNLINELNHLKPNLVIHAAGLTNIEDCELNPSLAYKCNVELSRNVADACRFLGIKLVHISTDHLFDGQSSMMTEEAPVIPINHYAKTKAKAEEIVSQVFPEALIIRTNIYGWGMSYRTSFSDFVINNLRAKTPISLFKDVFFTPILISNLADIIETLVSKGQRGIFNVASSERISKLEMGVLLAEEFNLDKSLIEPISISDKVNLVIRPKDMSLSTEKVTSILGLKLPEIQQGIKELKKQKNLGLAKELRAL